MKISESMLQGRNERQLLSFLCFCLCQKIPVSERMLQELNGRRTRYSLRPYPFHKMRRSEHALDMEEESNDLLFLPFSAFSFSALSQLS